MIDKKPTLFVGFLFFIQVDANHYLSGFKSPRFQSTFCNFVNI